MKKLFLMLLLGLVLLSIGLPGIVAQDNPPGSVLQLVDTDPLPGQEIGLTDSLTFYFDRTLNCGLRAQYFSIKPDVEGNLECDGTTLRFTPAQGFERATMYTVTILPVLVGQDGAQLLEEINFDFSTQGFLTVSEVFPAANTTVASDTVITVIFNRPVVPLVTVEDMASLPQPLRFDPAVAGTGEWINTSIYMFTPEPGLSGGITYNIGVDPNLTATDGSVLSSGFNWSFSVEPPQVIELNPTAQSSDVPLDKTLQVRFSQAMDQQSVEDNFYLRLDVDAEVPDVSGTFEWAEDSAGFRFTPDDLLALDSLYIAGFNEGVKSLSGGSGLTGTQRWNFVTVPAPAITGTDPFDGQTNAPPYGGFNIYFASPMNQKTLQDKFTIDPEPPREPELFYRTWEDSLSVSFPTEPSTTYTITVAPGMADPYGNTIDSPFTFSYTTDRYDSSVSLQVPGPVGFYNAYRDETNLFATYRNVSRLDLSLYTVPDFTFINRIMGDNYWDPAYNYVPGGNDLLRSWQIPTDSPENVLTYELLSLGTGGSSDSGISCPGSPSSRLKVGDTAIVVSEPDPLRARASVPDGDIVDLLYKDYQLPVVGGPICENDVLWWQVELRDDTRAWVAEGVGDEYFLDLRIGGQATQVTLPDGDSFSDLAPGIYLLTMNSPETAALSYQTQRHFVMVSTANLTMKASIDSVTVWATDVETGLPIAGAPIELFDQYQERLGNGVTDENGLVTVQTSRAEDLYTRRVALLRTSEQFGMAMTEWSNGIDPWMFDQNYNFFPKRYHVYAYTDRPIYRPGQPVYFRGVIRRKDDVTYTPPDMDTVPVVIYDDRGEIIYDQLLQLTQFGTFEGQFDLADDAVLGYYRISIDLPTSLEYQYEGGGVSFSVAEFRLPEFQVEVTPDEPQVVQGDTVSVTVDSTYFFGGSVSNASVGYRVVADPYFFNYDGPGGRYNFFDYNYDEGPREYYGYSGGLIADGTGTTDADGMLTIEVPAELEDATQSQTFLIEATVTDESQQAVSGRASVIVNQGLVYIGARPESYVSTAGEETNIEIISVDWESEVVPGQAIDVQIVERHWSSVQEQDELGRTTWTWEVEEIPVTEGSVTTGDDGKAVFTFTPPNGGVFKAIITTRDELGNEVRASTTMWVSSREYVSWRQQNSNRIDLIADQEDYNIGDTAEILIASPFQGTAEALVTVERGDLLTAERITLESNSYVYELPIENNFAPNVYVSVFIVKGVDENNPVAAFRMGTVQLGVEVERKEININITPDRERAQPRETVTYTVRTTDFNGDPVPAEVGVNVTDLASLSIAAPNSQDILSYFYGQQGLGIRTASPLTINTDQLTQTTLDTIKGGGGGGGELGVAEIRGNFVDTAYWNGSIVTDADGFASFNVTLPDNLTTWRVDARAVTSGADGLTLVGQDTFDLLSTKPLIIRPQTPRFFVVDDAVTLAAVVNNNSDQALEVAVTLTASGVVLDGDITKVVTIPSGARSRVTWDVTVQDVDVLNLVFSADGGQYSDAAVSGVSLDDQGNLPVYRYEAPETVGTAGVLRSADSRLESIVLPRRFNVTQGELTIQVDQSLAATTLDGLEYLRNYPYQCIEQTVSRFLPNIMTYRALNTLGLADAGLEAQLKGGVNFAIQKLYAEQKPDGGWGWFIQDRSDPLTTAYALIGLTEARKQGFTISDGTIANAQRFIQSHLIVPGLNQERWRMNRQTFLLYALARSGQGDVGRTVALYENRANLDVYATAFLAQTLALIDPSDTGRTDALLAELNSAAVVSATGIHWQEENRDYYNWNTDTRTTAIALNTFVMLRPESELIPNVVRYLMVQRRADAWETTQETAWAVMALTDWMVASGELQPDYTYSVSLNDTELTAGTVSSDTVKDSQTLVVDVANLLKDEANALLFNRSAGDGALYYTAHLRAFLPVPEIEPLDRGIIISRRYTLLNDVSGASITEAKVGDIVQVRLTIIVPNDLHYVIIEDPLPAGAEGVDPNLETSQQIGTRPGLDNSNPLSRGWGWWWFSNIEFRDEKVVLSSTYLPAGTYEYVYTIRPGLEGTYNVIPPTGYEFYFPEVYGRGAGSRFTILPSDG